LQEEELRDLTHVLGSMFPMSTERRQRVIKPYHKSILDWLADERKAGAFFVSLVEGNRLLAGFCWGSYLTDPGSLGLYEVRWAPDHLEASGRTDDAARLRNDNAFQKRRLELEIEESDPKYSTYLKMSADQKDLMNDYQVLLNQMAQQKRWHPQKPEYLRNLSGEADYCELYRFPCCGNHAITGNREPSQYRADGCREYS